MAFRGISLGAAAVVGALANCSLANAESTSYHPAYPINPKNSVVFFEVGTGDGTSWFQKFKFKSIGQIEFELFDDTVPITARNFRELCKGTCGTSPEGKPLHFKESAFHRIIPDFMIQGGDFTKGNGTGGCSIYGYKFKDEHFNGKAGKHISGGLLSMANAGKNTNGSQFFITVAPCNWLDGKHVVFGQVTKGYDIVKKLEGFGSSSGKPRTETTIMDCGCTKEPSV